MKPVPPTALSPYSGLTTAWPPTLTSAPCDIHCAKRGRAGSRGAEHQDSSSSHCANELGDLQETPGLAMTVSSSGHWGQQYLLYLFHRLGMNSK